MEAVPRTEHLAQGGGSKPLGIVSHSEYRNAGWARRAEGGAVMELTDYIRALRKSWPHALALAVLSVMLAGALTARTTKMYTASVTLFVSTAGGSDDVSALYNGGLAAQQRVQSYADLVSSERVATAVIQQLGLNVSPSGLAKRISGRAISNTMVLEASVADPDPGEAQRIADAVGAVFTTQIAEVEAPTTAPPASPSTGASVSTTAPASPVRVSVWEKAKRPTTPVSPKPVQNLALGLIAGLLLGFGLAVLRYRLDTTVKRREDVSRATGLATIGVVAFDKATKGQGLTVIESPRLPRAEAFRQLRTNLQYVDVDARPRVITITSTHAGEGKTTTTLNLAAVLAQTGARVVAVEADLRKPTFGSFLRVESASGLTSILVGEAEVHDVIQTIARGELAAITSGRIPPNPSEIVGSRAMSDLISQLRDEFDFVIIDAPPLLAVTDAAVISALTDGTIIVARAGKTRRDDLTQATTQLRNVDANILGVVLNMAPTKGPDAYTYGNYGSPSGQQRLAEPVKVTPAAPRPRHQASGPYRPSADASPLRSSWAPHTASEPEPYPTAELRPRPATASTPVRRRQEAPDSYPIE